jgi:hypothetical protein
MAFSESLTIIRAFCIGTFLSLLLTGHGCTTESEQPVTPEVDSTKVHIRINQVGYHPNDPKVAIAFSHQPVEGSFALIDAEMNNQVYEGNIEPSKAEGWGRFNYYYELDFSSVSRSGQFFLRLSHTEDRSTNFDIDSATYKNYVEDLLVFMRQQRCGYNPFLDVVCHQRDGRSFYGPMPDSTFIDASGGWHDAGDQLKYLITASNATARMLLAYELESDKFGDSVDEWGQTEPNDMPDVLDEAKWGLKWLHKLHPKPDQLFHQVADDRDHIGWKWPDRDSSDYGWGPDSYRPVYYADGEPQGLKQYKSEATGIGNLAGRYAAAMAMAYRIWNDQGDPSFAAKNLKAAKEVYKLGKQNEGFQQGNSYGAPYRYNERTWADDMEWGAAELYKATGNNTYIADEKKYASLAGSTSWMPRDTTEHYEYYPFVNAGHFALYPLVEKSFQDTLASYYREGLDAAVQRGNSNPYQIGVPFIWCSNNLLSALITQGLLYERMTGDSRYHDFIIAQRDWLFGRNPWGTSMFTGIPEDGEYPEDIHTSVWALTDREVPGGLVDGPVYATIYNSLRGLTLNEPDEFAPFQTPYVVYHDDIGDYSTNEPTMDGTAGAIYLMANFGAPVTK